MGSKAGEGALGRVAATAHLVASKRSVEAQRALPLLHDPVCAALLPEGSHQVRAWQQAELEALGETASSLQKDGGMEDSIQVASFLTLRCRYVDDELLSLVHALRKKVAAPGCTTATPGSCGGAGEGSGACTAEAGLEDGSNGHSLGSSHSRSGSGRSDTNVLARAAASGTDLARLRGRPRIQVVLLGAGNDTRPWRLPLGHDVHWFEADLPDAAAFKRSCMQTAGMQAVTPGCNAGLLGLTPDGMGNTAGGSDAGSATDTDTTAQQPRFPLRVGSWASLPADLSQPGWLDQLESQCGWDPAAPTIWVAEGLIYYLEQPVADRLMQELAAASRAAGLGVAVITAANPAITRGQQLAKELSAKEVANGAAADGGGKHWWMTFPQMKATLGNQPDVTLVQAGWERAECLATSPDFELMYRAVRPASTIGGSLQDVVEQEVRRCTGGLPWRYEVTTAGL